MRAPMAAPHQSLTVRMARGAPIKEQTSSASSPIVWEADVGTSQTVGQAICHRTQEERSGLYAYAHPPHRASDDIHSVIKLPDRPALIRQVARWIFLHLPAPISRL